jgi:hypothetical protein
VPRSILPCQKFPRNRLGFAHWLVHPDHPFNGKGSCKPLLQLYFGRGLVKTAEDFATRARCLHIPITDWLAVNFRESGWNIKALQKNDRKCLLLTGKVRKPVKRQLQLILK